jgi:hypothetical protein
MFGSSASASLSFLSTSGIFSNITPSILSPGANLAPIQFIYTDFGGSGMVCFSMQQTNTINGSYCYMDYNSNPICCQNLPGCPKPAPKGLLLKNEQGTLKTTDNSNQLKVQPNPSNGSALIYYKMAATNSCTDCKIRIMETGSGKVVCEKMLEIPVGTISIKDCNLAEGHYIVTLWNGDQLIISNKLEIVK